MSDSEAVDIEKIVEQVKADVVKRYSRNEVLSFEAVCPDRTMFELDKNCVFDETFYEERVAECQCSKNVEWYRDLEGSAIAVFVKKVVRKLSGFLVAPITEDQNRFNNNMIEVANQLYLRIEEQEKYIEELKRALRTQERNETEEL